MTIVSIEEAAQTSEFFKLADNRSVVVTSGGFDPLHIGHLRCIQAANELGDAAVLIVVVNGDGFLTRKKGRPFMPHAERMEIIDGLRGVDFVVGWDDGSQTVSGALEIIRPTIFAKGGDRSEAKLVPEFEVCERIGCKVVFGVGGTEKVQSSSTLIASIEPKLPSNLKFKIDERVKIISYVGAEVFGIVHNVYMFAGNVEQGVRPHVRYTIKTDHFHQIRKSWFDDVCEQELESLEK